MKWNKPMSIPKDFLHPYSAYNAIHSPNYILPVVWDDIVHCFKVTGGSVGLTDACVITIQLCLRKSDSI